MRLGAIILSLLLFSSCGILRRPENHFYSLRTLPSAGPVTAAAGLPVGIDGVELPPTLARRGIVVRGENGNLEVRGTHQWAAPLEALVLHTLSFDLANRLPDGMVILPGQPKPTGAMRSLFVVFDELSSGPDEIFVLDARWSIGGGTPRREQISIPLESTESASIASAMSLALAQLSDRIAAGL